jgi:flavin reductase (DIM6/NTAB) family NADH-FMN oxidoreductase RutF
VNTNDFKELAAWHNPSMMVVTTHHESEDAGCLVGFHSQSSIDPPRWAVWISKANHTYPVISDAPHVAVHFLGAEEHEIARRFGAETGDSTDKFSDIGHSRRRGVPVLDDCERVLFCRRIETIDTGGDHVCLVLDPVECGIPGRPSGGPLRYESVADVVPGHPEHS